MGQCFAGGGQMFSRNAKVCRNFGSALPDLRLNQNHSNKSLFYEDFLLFLFKNKVTKHPQTTVKHRNATQTGSRTWQVDPSVGGEFAFLLF